MPYCQEPKFSSIHFLGKKKKKNWWCTWWRVFLQSWRDQGRELPWYLWLWAVRLLKEPRWRGFPWDWPRVQHTRASQRALLHSDYSQAAGQGSHPPRLSTAGLQAFLGVSQVFCVLPFLAALLCFLHIRSQHTRNLQQIFRWLLETHLTHHSPTWWHCLRKVSADSQCVIFYSQVL